MGIMAIPISGVGSSGGSSSAGTEASRSAARLSRAASYPRDLASSASAEAYLIFPQTPAIFTTACLRASSAAISRTGRSKLNLGSRMVN